MDGTTEGAVLIAPLHAAERGHNIAPASWSPLEHQVSHLVGRNNTGKSVLMSVATRFRAEAAHLARARVLLFTRSYEDMATQLARLTLWQDHPNGLSRPQFTALPLPVDQVAVHGFDVDVQAAWTRISLVDLVQRAGRLRRQGQDDLPPFRGPQTGTSALIVVDEADADVSEIVQRVRVAEFRRLAKVERRLRGALRSLAEVSRILVQVRPCAPPRAVSILRLPLTGARTLTAPPLAA